ncbi:MAG: hypothetical protein ACRC67_40155 [Inquilinus sp.]
MIFEMLWLGSILLCAGLYLWGYAETLLPRRWRLPHAPRAAACEEKTR